ncbi:MAG: hypothetical protein ACRERX_12560 [Pseudomonas sp.]
MLRHLQRGTLAYAGLSVLPPFAAYHVPYITPLARSSMLADLREYLQQLDSLEPLSFPTLAGFDRQLNPLPRGEGV